MGKVDFEPGRRVLLSLVFLLALPHAIRNTEVNLAQVGKTDKYLGTLNDRGLKRQIIRRSM